MAALIFIASTLLLVLCWGDGLDTMGKGEGCCGRVKINIKQSTA
jgi:hypothetical protein